VENIEEISTNRTSKPLSPKGGNEGFSPPASGGDDKAGGHLLDEHTRRLDDLGSVQDGLKMSTDGQPKTGLSTDCIERPIEAGVAAGETAPLPAGSGVSSQTEPEARMPRVSSSSVKTAGKLPVPGPENGRYARGGGEFKQRDIPEFLRRDGKKADVA